MPRSENGGVVGADNFTTQNYARGVFSTKSQFVANNKSLWPRSGSIFLAVAHNTTPFISVYPFSSLGFGAKLSNPATLPGGNGVAVAFAPNGKTLIVGHTGTPYIAAYPFSGAGIGTKYSDPSTLPVSSTSGTGVAFNPSGNDVAVTHTLSPYVTAYPWSNGFGSKYSDPSTLPGTTGYSVDFSPNGNDIAIAATTTTWIYVYPWSSGFGTKYANHLNNYAVPASVNNTQVVRFHPGGNFLEVGYNCTSTLASVRAQRTYGFSSGSGFTSTYFDNVDISAAATEGSDVFGIGIHPSGTEIAYGTTGNVPKMRSFPFNSTTGFGTKYADPANDAAGNINGVSFHPDGNYLATAHATTPFITIWPWTQGTGAGTKITNPLTLPAGTGNDVVWGRV